MAVFSVNALVGVLFSMFSSKLSSSPNASSLNFGHTREVCLLITMLLGLTVLGWLDGVKSNAYLCGFKHTGLSLLPQFLVHSTLESCRETPQGQEHRFSFSVFSALPKGGGGLPRTGQPPFHESLLTPSFLGLGHGALVGWRLVASVSSSSDGAQVSSGPSRIAAQFPHAEAEASFCSYHKYSH